MGGSDGGDVEIRLSYRLLFISIKSECKLFIRHIDCYQLHKRAAILEQLFSCDRFMGHVHDLY